MPPSTQTDARLRTSGSSPECTTPRAALWGYGGKAYDVVIVGAAAFLAVMVVWNLFFTAELNQHRRFAADRVRLRTEIETWAQTLAQQERALDVDCQNLFTVTAPRTPQAPAELGLGRVRSLLKESTELLSATSRDSVRRRLRSRRTKPKPRSYANASPCCAKSTPACWRE
ncbi:MAG: hypothetical protein QM811_02085 [Pirellulales bacterium]